MLRQRDVLSKINVTPRELDSTSSGRRSCPRRRLNTTSRTSCIAVPQDATQAQLDELAKRAPEIVHERAAATEDFCQLAVAYSNSQTALEGGALGWRKGPELPTFFAEVVVAPEAGRGQRAAAHAHRLPPRQAQRRAQRRPAARSRNRCTCATS